MNLIEKYKNWKNEYSPEPEKEFVVTKSPAEYEMLTKRFFPIVKRMVEAEGVEGITVMEPDDEDATFLIDHINADGELEKDLVVKHPFVGFYKTAGQVREGLEVTFGLKDPEGNVTQGTAYVSPLIAEDENGILYGVVQLPFIHKHPEEKYHWRVTDFQ